MDRRQKRREAKQRALDLRQRIVEDERKPFWSRSLSWLAIAKILLEIFLLFLASEEDD